MTTNKPCVLGAGPMALHPEVGLAMAKPLAHHMTPYVPEGGSALAIMDRLQSEYNITVRTGIGENLDKALRIGHMG